MKTVLSPLRMVLMITDTETDKKISRLLTEACLPVCFQCRAQGTAKTEILDICGLQGRTRLVTAVIMPQRVVPRLYEKLEELIQIGKRGKGVAVSIPLTGVQESMMRLMNEEAAGKMRELIERDEQRMKSEAKFSMIIVSVAEGYSDAVIDAASKAGARGGSVLRGRKRGSEAMVQFLGISMQEEQEFVMIIVPKEKKAQIMREIGASCGLRSEAHGIILSIPVDEVAGLEPGME